MLDRVRVNAGGRIFETTRTTLRLCGCQYFDALLGFTGEQMTESKKRKRDKSENNDIDEDIEIRELFLDRSPDLFAHVLQYMRSARLPAALKGDLATLVDLNGEAEFFGLDGLQADCQKALKKCKDVIQEALEVEPPQSAKCVTFCVAGNGVYDLVPPLQPGEVCFIESATLRGRCSAFRYTPNEEEIKRRQEGTNPESKLAYAGCFLGTADQTDSGDFKLFVNCAHEVDPPPGPGPYEWDDRFREFDWRNRICLAHVALDHFHLKHEQGMNINFRQDLRTCLGNSYKHQDREPVDRSGSADESWFRFTNEGSGTWDVILWVGYPEQIPALMGRSNIAQSAPQCMDIPKISTDHGLGAAVVTTALITALHLRRRQSGGRARAMAMLNGLTG